MSVATGLLFGLVPAVQASRPDLHEELKGGAGNSVSMSKKRRIATNVLVVSEMALSLLLLVGAGLLLKDFVRLRNIDVGCRPALKSRILPSVDSQTSLRQRPIHKEPRETARKFDEESPIARVRKV